MGNLSSCLPHCLGLARGYSMNPNPYIRRVILKPYRKGSGPIFTLTVWDSGETDWRGQSLLRYEFREGKELIFSGADFAGSPLHPIDSNATIGSLLGFLTLVPGDTDPDYFLGYSPRQIDFAEQHGETLSFYCINRFGDR